MINWELLKSKVYDWDGSWRDIYILNTNVYDWEKLIVFLNQHCKLAWYNIDTDKNDCKIDLSQIKNGWNSGEGLLSVAKIFIKDKIQINLHFFTPEEIEFDIDPREFNSIEDHNELMKLLIDISLNVGKQLIITAENHSDYSLITVDKNKIIINPDLI
ncbi:hypothetical protein C8N26_0490 [Tenacibaculum lutimaris]|uniref:Uncharacterized protein n=1 Tax=Tenacibaculum lutimaris TaxID=285258 RepID=A0A420E4X1_9FLAO|nr:hypothetical protein [Tenacibaculum lutimaris]RKF05090.1 hypothetical protein C8N26_0490 [Tenacibaculum lutimaris]